MDRLSRRRLLVSGGVLGAAGTLGIVAPTAWTWASTGSVLGAGSGVDPHRVWDAEADPVVAALFDRGQVDLVNELLPAGRTTTSPSRPGFPPTCAPSSNVPVGCRRGRTRPSSTGSSTSTSAAASTSASSTASAAG